VRQPFSRSEVGLYKAVVLINRLNMFWGLDWRPCRISFVAAGRARFDFLISCVDTRAARAVIARVVSLKSRRFLYWLDAGNLADRGQFVLGQPLRKDRKDRANGCRVLTNSFRPSFTRGPTGGTGCRRAAQRRQFRSRAVH